jgi:hypothetical protein
MKVILLTGDTSITLAADAEKQRAELVKEAETITEISESFTMECATDVMRKLKGCLSSVESSRSEVKAPILDWGRKIDSMARDFLSPVNAQVARLTGLMNRYAAEQKRIADEAEAKRQAELRRIEEERQAALRAEAKRQQEARQAEEDARRAEEAKHVAFTNEESEKAQREADEANRVLAVDKFVASMSSESIHVAANDGQLGVATINALYVACAAKTPEEKAEVVSVAFEKINAEQSIRSIAQLNADRIKAQVMPVAVAKPAGLIVKEVWKFEVLSVDELYAANPGMVRMEANTAAINSALRAGAREIPGLRIWSEVETGVRK